MVRLTLMPLPATRRLAALLLAATLPLGGLAWPQARATAADDYARGIRLRAALDSTPRINRTRAQYEQVLNAFRAVYHADHADPNADSSVEAVAELLAEEGRIFHDATLFRSAVEQLEFLRRDFATSRYSVPALLTEGEIQARDLGDADAAQQCFTQFLAGNPRSPLAPQARAELRRLGVTASPPADLGSSPDIATSAAGRNPASPRSRTRAAISPSDEGPIESVPSDADTTAAAGPDPLRERDVPATSAAPPFRRSAPGTPSSDAGMAAAAGTAPTASTSSANPGPSATRPTRVVAGVPVFRPSAPHLALVTGIRHWSTANYTRVAVDLQDEVPFEASRVTNPDRIFFDLHGAKLAPELAGRAVTVTDGGFLERVRAAQFSGDVVRVVLDVSNVSDYSAFWLPNPSRLIIDIHGRPAGAPPPAYANVTPPPTPAPKQDAASSTPPPAETAKVVTQQPVFPAPSQTAASRAAAAGTPTPRAARTAAPGTFVSETAAPGTAVPSATPRAGDSLAAIAALSQQPSRVRATRTPTTAPVSAITAPQPAPAPVPAPPAVADSTPSAGAAPAVPAPARRKGKHTTATDTAPAANLATAETPGVAAHPADPDSMGGRSMVRALGLKINRIVVDAGHGGHDSGTLGPGGIEEKDVVLDVALRLGKLLKQRLGADVIYTRDDDTFIPLETRTAIANKAQADLFISVHANSSPDASARGVETYYLNFTTSADALEVAARENAVSDESIHQLSDLVKKITLQDKIAESREFATDVESSLYQGLETGNTGLKDRGVKKAPFVVLIGANMPSILAEISFLTNPDDAAQLRDGAYRQRIAESLYRGVARYERSLSGAHLEESASSR